MAAKKDKSGIEALRTDVQALADSFWKFRDAMLTDTALQQAEEQNASVEMSAGEWVAPSEAQIAESATLMGALSQPQRLRMAMMLADGPTNVATIVERLGLKTTGAAYHHLNVLINSGIAVQPERGTFTISPEAVSKINGLLVALFGSVPDESGSKSESKKKKKK